MIDVSSNPALVNPQYASGAVPTAPNMPSHQMAPASPNLTQQTTQPQMSQYSHGGHVHPEPHFIPAHFNKSELHALDEAQGARTHIPGTHTRIYKRLDNEVKDPHKHQMLMEHIAHAHADHHAHGEDVRMLAHHHNENGRYGDTEKAYITPHLKMILDHARGGESRNPHDGDPEYFGLNIGGLLSGLKNIAGKGMGMIGQVPGLLNRGYNAANNLYNQVNSNPYGNALIEGGKQAFNSKMGGADTQTALRQGLSTGINTRLNGMEGNLANLGRGVAEGISQGHGLSGIGQSGINNLQGPVGDVARGAMTGYQGGGIRGGLLGAGGGGIQHLPAAAQPYASAMHSYMQPHATGGPIGPMNEHAYMPSAIMYHDQPAY